MGTAVRLVPVPRLLGDRLTVEEQLYLPGRLVGYGMGEAAQGVHVLYFAARAVSGRAIRPDRNVTVDS